MRATDTAGYHHNYALFVTGLPTNAASAWFHPVFASSFPSVFVFYAACVTPYIGAYTWPVLHSLCSSTASFLATAITALFLPFLPPREASSSPHLRRSE